MSHHPIGLRITAAAALLVTVALGAILAAQTTPARPNVRFTLYASLAYTPLPGDFDGDGIVDLVAGRSTTTRPVGSDLIFKRGRGDGSFNTDQVIATGYFPLAAADVDHDGNLDLIADNTNGIYVMRGVGDGTFALPVLANSYTGLQRVVTADFDGNGTLDLAGVQDDGSTLEVFSGSGAFAFAGPTAYPVDTYPEGIAAGDFNNDGKADIAVATRDFKKIDLFLNQGGMSFTASGVTLDRPPVGVAATDIDGDGLSDLLVAAGTEDFGGSRRFIDGMVYVLHGNGNGTFTRSGVYPTNIGPISIAVADFNRDGRLDVATTNSSETYDNVCDGRSWAPDSVSILPGLAGGGFGAAATFTPVPQAPALDVSWPDVPLSGSLRTADLNGDGQQDLVAPGAVIMNRAAAANHPPVADAGPDRQDEASPDFGLRAVASDPDNDWLTFEWRDETGRLLGTLPQICVFGEWRGRHTFSLTVKDGRGGVSTDTVNIDFPGGPLPSGMSSSDIGAVGAAGSASFDGSIYTVSGAGADIWGSADEFHFVSQPVSGDFDISARVTSVENFNAWTKAGIMIRDGLAAGARHASLFVTPTTEKGIAFQRRPETNRGSVSSAGPAMTAPVWVKLSRRGDNVVAYYRKGATDQWTAIGSQMFVNLPTELAVGFAVSSHVDGAAATAQFTDLSITPVEVPADTWKSEDVGATGATGSTTFDGTSYSVSGAGADLWNGTREFHWMHRSFTGPFDFVTRVASIDNVNEWTKAGILMRSGADNRYVFLAATPTTTKGVSWQWGNRDGTSVAFAGPKLAPPVWLRMQRLPGGNIQASWRLNETDPWVAMGQLGMANLPPTLELGLAVSSHVRGKLATAKFDHVSLTRDTTELPVGWQSRDIGDVTFGGGTFWATTGQAMMTATGADIWGTRDEFQFVSTRVSGDVDISALVYAVQDVDAWTKAGLMLRAPGDAADAPQASVVVTPGKGIAFQRRRSPGAESVNTAGPMLTAPVYVRLTRSGNTVSAYYRRTESDAWTLIGTERSMVFTSDIEVGLALSSHVDGTYAGATFRSVTLNGTTVTR